jgi:hypothetical protein
LVLEPAVAGVLTFTRIVHVVPLAGGVVDVNWTVDAPGVAVSVPTQAFASWAPRWWTPCGPPAGCQ